MRDFLKDFITYISNEKRYSPHTVRAYTDDLGQFSDFCVNENISVPLIRIQSKHIRNWVILLLNNGISTRSVNRKISTLKSFYKYLLREGLIESNPVLQVISPKVGKQLPSFVNQSQMDLLLDNRMFTEDFAGWRDRVIIEMLYHTGMRLSELINLRDVDIDIHQMHMKVLGKRNKERLIPFTPELKKTILAYKHQRDSAFDNSNDYFLVTNAGEKVYPKFIYRVVNKHLKTVTTLSKTSPHVLRHTFATHMLNNGADINAIKEILGHANLSATQVYTHNSFKKLKSIYNKAHPRA